VAFNSASSETNISQLSYANIKNSSSFIGFDFLDVWEIDTGVSSPYLKSLPKPSSVIF